MILLHILCYRKYYNYVSMEDLYMYMELSNKIIYKKDLLKISLIFFFYTNPHLSNPRVSCVI